MKFLKVLSNIEYEMKCLLPLYVRVGIFLLSKRRVWGNPVKETWNQKRHHLIFFFLLYMYCGLVRSWRIFQFYKINSKVTNIFFYTKWIIFKEYPYILGNVPLNLGSVGKRNFVSREQDKITCPKTTWGRTTQVITTVRPIFIRFLQDVEL